jgi:glycosyltransferase involved in cell wall biosynthesis
MNGLDGWLDGARILHLFANYKWTGPADPAIRTAARLRALGVDVLFAQAGFVHAGGEHRVAEELWHWRLPVVTGLELRKHFHIASLRRDVQALRALLVRDRYDLLHCHQTSDHLIAALACRRAPRPPVIVRSLYDPEPPLRGLRTRFCFARTHGVVAPTRRAAAGVAGRFGLGADAVLFQEPVVEARAPHGPDLRVAWGLAPAHRAIGITARIQPHRRFELLWQVARAVVDQVPAARFVLLGRGNEQDTQALVTGPVRALRLQDHVVLPGYLREPDYSAALRSLDLFLFLVPGSDGTCRAVREAMAQGLPVVATQRGILPDLLAPVRSGEVPGAAVAEDADALARELIGYLRDEPRRRAAGIAARRRAELDMDPQAAARALAAFYARLLGARRR